VPQGGPGGAVRPSWQVRELSGKRQAEAAHDTTPRLPTPHLIIVVHSVVGPAQRALAAICGAPHARMRRALLPKRHVTEQHGHTIRHKLRLPSSSTVAMRSSRVRCSPYTTCHPSAVPRLPTWHAQPSKQREGKYQPWHGCRSAGMLAHAAVYVRVAGGFSKIVACSLGGCVTRQGAPCTADAAQAALTQRGACQLRTCAQRAVEV
jgi:hypothetical protein